MIPLNDREAAALDLVAEARRLYAAASYAGSDRAAWHAASVACARAWRALLDLGRDNADADARLGDIRRQLLREQKAAAEAVGECE